MGWGRRSSVGGWMASEGGCHRSPGKWRMMIMGSHCSRTCRFCAVPHGPKTAPDPNEPKRIADTIKKMKLDYVTITSVTRDDLPDGGASFFADTIHHIRKFSPDTLIEILIPDFQGDLKALQTAIDAKPDVLNHNIETVKRLYSVVRPEADYQRSLALLKYASKPTTKCCTKSGIMLGLGETKDEIHQTMLDLLSSGCQIVTLGQYLKPSKAHLPVQRYVTPEEFDEWRVTGQKLGFKEVSSGPFVRSSYHAKKLFKTTKTCKSVSQNQQGGLPL